MAMTIIEKIFAGKAGLDTVSAGDTVVVDVDMTVLIDLQFATKAAKHVFYEVRPGWTDQVSPGDIVVAGENFGLGSSRPVAALFTELGVAGLVAEEFNSLFFRNAVNAGLPAMTVPDATSIFHEGDVGTFDLSTGTWRNETTGASGPARRIAAAAPGDRP